MNAAADEAHVRPRRIMGLDKAALEQKLKDWGDWIEKRLDQEGYPQCDAVAAALEGSGGGTPGHRILFQMMPPRLWSIHQRILRLPDHEHAAVVVWYVPAMHVEQPRSYVIYPVYHVYVAPREFAPGGVLFGTRYVVHQRDGRVVGDFHSREAAEIRAGGLTRADAKLCGSPWTTEQKASRLGIEIDALYKRLERARNRLLGVLPLFGVSETSRDS